MFRSKGAGAAATVPPLPTRLAYQCGKRPPIIDPVPLTPSTNSQPTKVGAKHRHTFTPDTLLDVLKCPKKYLLHTSLTQGDQPNLTSTDMGLLEDGLSFRHLSQALITSKHTQSSYRITSASYANALEETADFLKWYFADYLPTKDPKHEKVMALQSATLACVAESGAESAELRSRIGLLTYNPATEEWSVIGSRASSKLTTFDKVERYIKHMFQLYCLQNCNTALSASVCHTSFAEKLKDAPLFTASIQPSKLHVTNCPVHLIQPRRVQLSVDAYTPRILNTMIGTMQGTEIRAGFEAYYLGDDSKKPATASKATAVPIAEELAIHLASKGLTRSSLDINIISAILGFGMGQLTTVNSNQRDLLACYKLDGDGKPSALSALSEALHVNKHTSARLTNEAVKDKLVGIPHYSMFGENCAKCEYFQSGYCRATSAADAIGNEAVFHLPMVTARVKRELYNRGTTTPNQILDEAASGGIKLSEKQRLFVEAASNKEILVNPEKIQKWLASVEYPLIAIDFESSSFALPPFSNMMPYQAIPFQYSAAVIYGDITDPAYSASSDFYAICAIGEEFDPTVDPRGYLGDQLGKLVDTARAKYMKLNPSVAALAPPPGSKPKGVKASEALTSNQSRISKDQSKKMVLAPGRGSVMGHNVSFEKQCFKGIAQHSTSKKYATLFDSLVFIDSLKIASEGIVHPLSLGSNSLKKLVPALLPHLAQYTGLTIQDGGAASSVYRNWHNDFSRKLPQEFGQPAQLSGTSQTALSSADYKHYKQRRDELVEKYGAIRSDLISYCNMDTVQMVEVVKEIARIGELARTSGKARVRGDGWVALPFSEVESTRPKTQPLTPKL